MTGPSPPCLTANTESELLKLWKGLFYCMWMSDKPLVQEELAKRAFSPSETTLCFSTPLVPSAAAVDMTANMGVLESCVALPPYASLLFYLGMQTRTLPVGTHFASPLPLDCRALICMCCTLFASLAP